MPQLQHVDLQDNDVDSLVVAPFFPNLHTLRVDRNGLHTVMGLEALSHLQVFSAREQQSCKQAISANGEERPLRQYFSRFAEVKNLYLSANPIPSIRLKPSLPVLNLQSLELASVGLKSLPSCFAQATANLRSLNLNLNALKDLRPLANMPKLCMLEAAGNRISKLRETTQVLRKLVAMKHLDLRDNPITIGFYAHTATGIVSKYECKTEEAAVAEVTDSSMTPTSPFSLPIADREANKSYKSRLDEDTGLRRRIYELLLATGCGNLTDVDGLPFRRGSYG